MKQVSLKNKFHLTFQFNTKRFHFNAEEMPENAVVCVCRTGLISLPSFVFVAHVLFHSSTGKFM